MTLIFQGHVTSSLIGHVTIQIPRPFPICFFVVFSRPYLVRSHTRVYASVWSVCRLSLQNALWLNGAS